MNSLFEMDDWLADDEFDKKSEVYQGKLEGSKAEDFAHIEEATVTELSSKVKEASSWLDERQQVSANAPKTQDPPFFASEISDKAREINASYLAVKAIPKPEPKKEEEKKEDATKSDSKDAEEDVKMEDATAKEDAKEDVEMENAAS